MFPMRLQLRAEILFKVPPHEISRCLLVQFPTASEPCVQQCARNSRTAAGDQLLQQRLQFLRQSSAHHHPRFTSFSCTGTLTTGDFHCQMPRQTACFDASRRIGFNVASECFTAPPFTRWQASHLAAVTSLSKLGQKSKKGLLSANKADNSPVPPGGARNGRPPPFNMHGGAAGKCISFFPYIGPFFAMQHNISTVLPVDGVQKFAGNRQDEFHFFNLTIAQQSDQVFDLAM